MLLTALTSTTPAHAHVLVTDTSGSKGVILHIVPDDDPIAGSPAKLYFDTQESLTGFRSAIKLSVRDTDGNETALKPSVNGSLITSNYTFARQGVYTITVSLPSDSRTYTFTHAQRVSRGATASPLDAPSYPWAQILLIASGLGLAVLAIIVINRRSQIARQSTF